MIEVPKVPEVWEDEITIPQELYIIAKEGEALSSLILDKNGEWLDTYKRGDSGWNDAMFFENTREARKVLGDLNDPYAYIVPVTEAYMGFVKVETSKKLSIPFEEEWLYEGTLKYPISFKVPFYRNLEVYGVKKEDGTVGVTSYNSPVFDNISDLINYNMKNLEDEYGNISDIKIGNPEILED